MAGQMRPPSFSISRPHSADSRDEIFLFSQFPATLPAFVFSVVGLAAGDCMEGELGQRVAEALVAQSAAPTGRPVIVAGSPGSGKSRLLRALAVRHTWPLLNTNLALAQVLVAVPEAERAYRVGDAMVDAADEAAGTSGVLLIDDIELLFTSALKVNPLKMLARIARNRAIAAVWPGGWDGTELSWAIAGHPEHRRWPAERAMVFAVI